MVSEKLKELGIELPPIPKPLAAYVPYVVSGNLVFTAGQLPMKDGMLQYAGQLGKEVTEEDGKRAAAIAALNGIAVIADAAGGVDNISRIVKITVFVNSADGFGNQPEVANGASELLVTLFGEDGKHARSAVGANALPRDTAVEIEMIAEIKQ